MWPVPEFPNYLIYYVPRNTTLEVVRLLHSAQDRATNLGEET